MNLLKINIAALGAMAFLTSLLFANQEIGPEALQLDLAVSKIENGYPKELIITLKNISSDPVSISQKSIKSMVISMMVVVPAENYEDGKIVPVNVKMISLSIPLETAKQGYISNSQREESSINPSAALEYRTPLLPLLQEIKLGSWLTFDEIRMLSNSDSFLTGKLEMMVPFVGHLEKRNLSMLRVYSERIRIVSFRALLEILDSTNIPEE